MNRWACPEGPSSPQFLLGLITAEPVGACFMPTPLLCQWPPVGEHVAQPRGVIITPYRHMYLFEDGIERHFDW
jgi:hypothetical protein